MLISSKFSFDPCLFLALLAYAQTQLFGDSSPSFPKYQYNILSVQLFPWCWDLFWLDIENKKAVIVNENHMLMSVTFWRILRHQKWSKTLTLTGISKMKSIVTPVKTWSDLIHSLARGVHTPSSRKSRGFYIYGHCFSRWCNVVSLWHRRRSKSRLTNQVYLCVRDNFIVMRHNAPRFLGRSQSIVLASLDFAAKWHPITISR